MKDPDDNAAACTAILTVADETPPTIRCPASVHEETDRGTCSARVRCEVTARDACPGVSVSCEPPLDSPFPVGTTTVECTATDAAGLTSTCSFTVTVYDREKPEIRPPANIVCQAANGWGAVVSFVATATDNCPGVAIEYSRAPGSIFPVGRTTVHCTAIDASGNRSAAASFKVTVRR